MKKILALVLTVVMLLSMSVTAFAAGAFISSPSNNNAPTLVEGKNEDENCDSTLEITSYADRNGLGSAGATQMEKAYDHISSTDNLAALCDGLKNKANNAGVSGEHLGVSDLFHIGADGCNDHDNHGAFNMSLSADTLNNFFALMRYDGSQWHLVENAKVEGGKLVFSSEELGTFAVVTKNKAPQTGDVANVLFITTLGLGVALAVVLVALKKKARA